MAALEGVLFAKHLDGHVTFADGTRLSRRQHMCRLELTRVSCPAGEFGAWHGPACLFRVVPQEVGLRGGVGIGCRFRASALWGVAFS